MKTLSKSVKFMLGLIAAIVLLCVAGTMDHTEEVIYSMPDSTYNDIKKRLSAHGNEPSDYQIANFYLEHYGRR